MNHIDRKKNIAIGAIPPKGTEEHKKTIEFLKRNENKQVSEFAKKNWERANLSLEAQYHSTCELTSEKNLRHFLLEFNNRAWESGLWSMPTMFNVMESFFKYRKPEGYFELIEEENYYVSIQDFLDFVTSDNFITDPTTLQESITKDIIYNFDISDSKENFTFKNSNGEIFIIRAISIIRRDNEVTLSIVSGKKQTDEDVLDTELYKNLKPANPDKEKIINKIKSDLKNKELEFEYLDDNKEYIKTVILIRLDIETLTIDTMYVGVESNMMFSITTDDRTIFTDRKGNFPSEKHEESYKNNIEKIKKYDAISDLAKYLVYLPFYFNVNEEIIKTEDKETEYKKLIQNPLKKRKFQNTLGYKASIKTVFFLDKNDTLAPDKIILRDDLFKIEKSGFWKTLSPEDVGMDKKGKTIHGKTWVNQSSSWFEAKNDDLTIEKEQTNIEGPNVGYIYILRNPTMGKNIFKIGLTRNEVDYRVEQLSKTSVPDKFYKAQEWIVKDCVLAERQIHEALNSYRVDPRREFFEVPYDKAIEVITNTVKIINE
jgi:hypothetical protein